MECSDISLANALGRPWAMMIHFFDADSTIRAMKSPGWSQYLTGFAIRKLVVLHVFRNNKICGAIF